MMTLRAMLATTALICATPALAQDFGAYGGDTMRSLALDYPGRFTGLPESGTTFFAAADYMAQRLSFGGQSVARQDFDARDPLGNLIGPSQNLVVSMPGTDGRTLVVGAHFDTADTSPDLQGVDDNASGAGLLTELAAHMSGLQTRTGLEFVAFGAEEVGLQGAQHYVDTLSADQRANLAGMINIDSLITGDFMYAHAGVNYLDNSDLLSLRNRAHEIARELGIDLRSNPGLNPAYPILTGCCSDAEVFEQFDIPVLWLEATNWQIGNLDGYDQTTNPDIPGGRTWHSAEYDNWDFLRAVLGPERFEQRQRDYARILTRLLAEETGADLIASAQDAGLTGAQIADLALRQQSELSALSMRATADRLDTPGAIGQITPSIAVQGLASPDSSATFDRDGGAALMARVGAGYQVMDGLSVGGQLAYARTGDDLNRGDIESQGYQLSLDAAYAMGDDWVTGAISWGKSDLSGTRAFALTSGLGTTIVARDFDWSADAYALGARVQAGRNMELAPGMSWGPVIGLDYSRTRIGGFAEEGGDRRAVTYSGQAIESLEVQLGARIGMQTALAGRDVALSAQGSLVRDLAEGAPTRITVTDSTGEGRSLALDGQDRGFVRLGVQASTALTDQADAWVTLDSRLGHDAGSQATLGAGLGLRF